MDLCFRGFLQWRPKSSKSWMPMTWYWHKLTPMVTLGGSHFKEPPIWIWRIEGCHNSFTTSLRKVWGFETLMVVGAGIGVPWLRWLALSNPVSYRTLPESSLFTVKSCTFWIILDDVLVHSNLLHPWDVWLCMLIPKTSFDTEEVPVKLLRYVEISFTTWVKNIFVLEHFEPLSTTYFMIFLNHISVRIASNLHVFIFQLWRSPHSPPFCDPCSCEPSNEKPSWVPLPGAAHPLISRIW